MDLEGNIILKNKKFDTYLFFLYFNFFFDYLNFS